MNTMAMNLLDGVAIIPIIQAEDPDTAVQIARALAAGGLNCVEIVLRNAAALACLEAVASNVSEVVAGAGTVLNISQFDQAIDAGARFIVAPGIDEETVTVARQKYVPIFPGAMTPSEVQRAYNLGVRVVKFFPAAAAGGPATLKAISAAFGDMQFIPTGGINAANLADYLTLDCVAACGGSWVTPKAAIAKGDFDAITQLAAAGVALAQQARG
jgi:2-dehydro-3-deoxyphosphogluconate aldolase/(4S)-4-hydroxy-2-oxoglutarate aldolase